MYEFLDKRYAQALYDVALSKGKVDKYIDDLEGVVDLIKNNKELKNVLHNPEVSTSEKKRFLINIFKGKMDEDLLTFLLLLVEKDRMDFIEEKLIELKKIDLINKRTKVAKIRTAVPLEDYQREKLKEKLMKKYDHTIILEEIVDPEIIGGMIIVVGDDLIDASIKNNIDDLKHDLMDKLEVNL